MKKYIPAVLFAVALASAAIIAAQDPMQPASAPMAMHYNVGR